MVDFIYKGKMGLQYASSCDEHAPEMWWNGKKQTLYIKNWNLLEGLSG